MKKILAIFLMGIILAIMVPTNISHAQTSTINSIGYAGYQPGRLQIDFPHTTQIASNVTSLSGGLFTYKVISGFPNSEIDYFLNNSDIYTVVFDATYPIPINGNVTWLFFSPEFVPQEGSYTFANATTLSLVFTIELLPPNTPPSALAIANATSGILISSMQQLLAQYKTQQDATNASFQNQIYVMFAAIILLVSAVVALIFTIYRRSSRF